MGSPTSRRTSAYSEDNDYTREQPTEGMRGVEGVGTPRYSGRGDGRTKGGTHTTREGVSSQKKDGIGLEMDGLGPAEVGMAVGCLDGGEPGLSP